jgi:hypothetical protein
MRLADKVFTLDREGHLWGEKHVTIPVSQIGRIEEHTVYLKLDREQVEALPAIPVRRRSVHSLTPVSAFSINQEVMR